MQRTRYLLMAIDDDAYLQLLGDDGSCRDDVRCHVPSLVGAMRGALERDTVTGTVVLVQQPSLGLEVIESFQEDSNGNAVSVGTEIGTAPEISATAVSAAASAAAAPALAAAAEMDGLCGVQEQVVAREATSDAICEPAAPEMVGAAEQDAEEWEMVEVP